MARLSLCVSSALLLILLLLPLPAAWAEPSGTIEGQITNGTAGGGSAGGLPVTLHRWIGQEEQEPLVMTADSEGRFRFGNLETADNRAYVASVEYGGATYNGEAVIFEVGETTRSAPLVVFEPTTDSGPVRVQRSHVIIEPDQSARVVMVTEMLLVSNASDRAYVGSPPDKPEGARETLRVTLPADVRDLQFESMIAGRFQPADDGFVYTGPLAPGTTEIVYSYLLAYAESNLKITRSVNHPVDSINVLMPDQGIGLSSDRLSPVDPPTLGGQRYLHLAGGDLPAGTSVTIQLTGKMAAASDGNRDTVRWFVPGLMVIGLGMALAYSRQLSNRRVVPPARGRDNRNPI